MEHEADSFDMVFDEVVLSHLRGEYADMLTPAAKELHRVTKEGGLVVLSGYVKDPLPLATNNMLDDMVNEMCQDNRFTEIHRKDITEQNAAGGIAAVEHILGDGAMERLRELFTLMTLGEDGFEENDWDTQVYVPDPEQIGKFGLFGKICATVNDPARFAAVVEDLKTHDREATGLPDMPINIQQTGAVPAELLVKYGLMMDATIMGCITVLKRSQQKKQKRKKRCWVVTLKVEKK